MKTSVQNLFITLVWLALPALVQAQFTFTTNSGAITITGYNTAASPNAVIPAMTNGYPVTSIGPFAFRYSSITNVTIPNGITSIGQEAFEEASLTSVTIPNSVTSIGLGAFFGSLLTNVTIPDSVTYIGVEAFDYCPNLTNIVVDAANPDYSSTNGVLFDKEQATLIQFPNGLTNSSDTIPNSVTYIGEYAFNSCGLTNVTIGNSVTGIGEYAFVGCPILTSVTIGNSVTSIGFAAFEDCWDLTSITIPNSVTSIGGSAFFGCSSLTNVTIGNSVTSIGEDAFAHCSGLTSITIPNSVTSIGALAFYICSGLSSVTIGNSVTNVGVDAFADCTALTSAYFLGNAPPHGGYSFSDDLATVYYLSGTSGWGSIFGGVPAVLWNPQANTFSFTGGQFEFNLTGPTNAVIVVEACTNLSHPVWVSVSTNTLSGLGSSAFSDPAGYPMRYYRFRSP